jgi:hypothetical protein
MVVNDQAQSPGTVAVLGQRRARMIKLNFLASCFLARSDAQRRKSGRKFEVSTARAETRKFVFSFAG